MNYLSQFFWKKSTIGYGCLVLLGSVTVAGISEIEIKNQIFSKWFQKIERSFRDRVSRSSEKETRPVTTEDVFSPFKVVGEEVSRVAKATWPYITIGWQTLTFIFKDISSLWTRIKSFFSTLTNPVIFNKIFENLHLKFWKILLFLLIGSSGRDQFLNLFSQEKQDSTMKGLDFLMGSHAEKNKKFRAKAEVFPYLLARWLDDPEKVTDKFERLTTKIKNLIEKIDKGNGAAPRGGSAQGNGLSVESQGNGLNVEGQGSPVDEKYVYELGILTIRDYLDIEKGWKEELFNTMWVTEIMSKIQTGIDVTSGSKTFLPVVLKGWW